MEARRVGLIAVVITLATGSAWAASPGECPAGVQSCIVVPMTPDEVKTLTGPGGIYDQALWANRSGMEGLISAWKQKLLTAPAGTIPEPPKKEEPKQ